jgi:hypothetical protein
MGEKAGYIALYRAIFNHPLFKDDKPFNRGWAWVYLIADAAWRTEQRRVGRIPIILERGQTAASQRVLAKAWGWHPAKVQRFLGTLKRDGMIRTMVPDAIADATSDALRRSRVTVITICNYSKFNDAAVVEKILPTRGPMHKPLRSEQQPLDLGDEFASEPPNQRTKYKTVEKKETGEKYRGPPRHGMVSKKHGTKYVERSNWEWDGAAATYREAHNGAEPIPDRHGGFWFPLSGNAQGRRRSA